MCTARCLNTVNTNCEILSKFRPVTTILYYFLPVYHNFHAVCVLKKTWGQAVHPWKFLQCDSTNSIHIVHNNESLIKISHFLAGHYLVTLTQRFLESLTFRHRASSTQDRRFATLQRTLFIYLINKYISLSDICLTVHH